MGTVLGLISEVVTVPLSALDHPNLAKQATWSCSQCSEKNWDQPAPEAVSPGFL